MTGPILAIETATQTVGVALADDDGVIASFQAARGRRHTETLAPAIEFVCRYGHVALRELVAIAVDIGPGLFTGLRVGLATAKGLALALDLPIIRVPSTDVLAYGRPGRVGTAIDARRGELYVARYDDGRRTLDAAVVKPDEAARLLAGTDVVVGDAPGALVTERAHPSPVSLALAALGRAPIAAELVSLLYLRAPDAEVNFVQRARPQPVA